MLEDITMEKKLGRPGLSPKGIAEIKKNQDVSSAKPHPKTNGKREKLYTKDEPPRSAMQSTSKTKPFSRKSSTRYSHREIGGKVAELAGLDDEFGSKRSKKQNFVHLINIQCKPRESYSSAPYHSASKAVFPPNSIRYLMSTHKHKYNKEQFLQAICQFVVRNDADYSVHMAEPDILVDWSLIEKIRVPSFETVTCPICLDTPIAGKITRCGHIYCWPCILHYLSLTDQTWYKCPICYEAIHIKDLKSVEIVYQNWFDKGQEITFKLMKRERGSTLSVPVLEPTRVPYSLLSVSEKEYTTVYSKLLLIDREDISEIIKVEENELLDELKNTEGTPEECFVETALELLKNRKFELSMRNRSTEKGIKNEESCDVSATGKIFQACIAEAGCSKNLDSVESYPVGLCSDVAQGLETNPTSDLIADHNSTTRTRYESVSSSDEIPSSITVEDLEMETTSSSIPSKYYYFYQAKDGQQIYLHSLNARMLEKQYGSLERCPPELTGNIVEIEMGTMTEELRKRLRYLDHLPITCQFQVVEIHMGEPLISTSTKVFFKDQLEKRSRLRQKKAKEEKKLERRAEMKAREQYGCSSRLSPVRLHLDSLAHFPQCGAEESFKLSQRPKSPRSSPSSSPASSRRSVSPVTSAVDGLTLSNNTFAQKLKDTRKDNGWQKRAKVNSESDTNCASHSRNYISEALDVALMQARLVKEGGEQNVGKSKKRKKKPKPVPLYSVGIAYNNS